MHSTSMAAMPTHQARLHCVQYKFSNNFKLHQQDCNMTSHLCQTVIHLMIHKWVGSILCFCLSGGCTCLLKYRKPLGQLMLWKGEKDSMEPSMVMGWSLIAPREVTSIQWGDGPQMNTCTNKGDVRNEQQCHISPSVDVFLFCPFLSYLPLSTQRCPQSIWTWQSDSSHLQHPPWRRSLSSYLSSALISFLWS